MSYSSASRGPSQQASQDDYFSVDDILATQERMVCAFSSQIINMGHLDPGSATPHIEAGSKVELPCWLAQALCGGNRRRRVATATVELPKQYREVYREILSAEAEVVDLHRLGPYYYRLGSHLVRNFDHAETPDISKSLLKAFQSRLRRIMDGCQNALDSDSSSLTATLDQSERSVFERGSTCLSGYMRWETRQTERLTSSVMVSNLKKRKRAQMNDDDDDDEDRIVD